MDTKNGNLHEDLKNRLKRGVVLGGICAAVAFIILFLLKIVATSLTIGSGGSGGIFAPSLFIGAMLGTTVGYAFGSLFPSITAPASAYGIAGMAAVFAGAARAPGVRQLELPVGDN